MWGACAGTAFGAFYKDPSGANTLIGNYSLIFTPQDANTVKLDFPSNFNAATLFTTTGSYRLIETYFPTFNFTQPQPLVVGFTVTVCIICAVQTFVLDFVTR